MAPETPLQAIMLDGDSSLLCSQIISFNSLMPGQLAWGAEWRCVDFELGRSAARISFVSILRWPQDGDCAFARLSLQSFSFLFCRAWMAFESFRRVRGLTVSE
jgi:hypothetical protein